MPLVVDFSDVASASRRNAIDGRLVVPCVPVGLINQI